MKITASVSTRDVDELLLLLPEKIAKPAAKRAIARASASTAQLARDIVRDELGIKPRELTRLKFVQVIPKSDGQGAGIVIRGRGAPLEIFQRVSVRKRSGVSATVAGKSIVLKHAFLYPGKGGPIIAERQRVGGKRVGRGPIKRIYGPAPASAAAKPQNLQRLEDRARERFHIEVLRDIEFRLKNQGKFPGRRHGPSAG